MVKAKVFENSGLLFPKGTRHTFQPFRTPERLWLEEMGDAMPFCRFLKADISTRCNDEIRGAVV